MNILFLTKGRGNLASFEVRLSVLLTFASTSVVVIAALLIWAGYILGQQHGESRPGSQLVNMQQELIQQRDTLQQALTDSEENINALSLQLGRMQAHVLRLDALGQRLTKMAKLDKGEFNFEHEPAQGGPELMSEKQNTSMAGFMQTMEELQKQLQDREQQLSVLESMMMNRNLQTEAYPTGRPVKSGWISSYYGKRTDPFTGKPERHHGMDFAGKSGSEVVSVAAGVVTWIGDRSGYGSTVEVTHGNGYVTRYAHNKVILVKSGDKVEKGQALALMGSTGRSTGPHVHFEVLRNGKAVNPLKYIKASR